MKKTGKSAEPVATHREVLELLTAKAREGSISAAIALERALRLHDDDEDGPLADELDRLINDAKERR